MERLPTMEPQVIAVTEPLGAGQGAISAKHHEDTTEQATRRMEEAATYCEQIPAGRPSGCIDGRGVLETLDNGVSELGPKTAGGSALSGLFAFIAEGHVSSVTDVYTGLARIVAMLEEHGEVPARFHIDADHKQAVYTAMVAAREKYQSLSSIEDFIAAVTADKEIPQGTGCGMGDQFEGAVTAMADRPRTFKRGDEMITETAEDITERLVFMRANSAALAGESFSDDVFDTHVANATAAVDIGAVKGFNEMKALIIADRVLLDAGMENGAFGRIEVLATSEEGVHGHVEDGLLVVQKRSYAFNLTRYQAETGGSYFSYEQWVKQPIAAAISTGISDYERAVLRNAQAIDAANVAGAFQLADGSQRVGIVQ